MSDLISRHAAIDAIEITSFDDYDDYKRVRGLIEYLPSAYPKKGKWIKEHLTVYLNGTATCSECGGEAIWNSYGKQCLTKFCPNCGADMRGEK